MRNITAELAERMAKLQAELEGLSKQRMVLDDKQRLAEQKLQALRVILDWEKVSQGEPSHAATSADKAAAWLGVGPRAAVRQLLTEHPEWKVAEIRQRLEADGFDFKGKKPGNVINMAVVSLRRKQNGGG